MKVDYGKAFDGFDDDEPPKKVLSIAAQIYQNIRNTPEVEYYQGSDGRWTKATTYWESMPEGFTPPAAEVVEFTEARSARSEPPQKSPRRRKTRNRP